MSRKGIILAGGHGSRLRPATDALNKHLMPVYDKPMIYYPLSTLMLAGVRDVLIILTEFDVPIYRKLLDDGSKWGINISYEIQKQPNGIAEALLIAKSFLNGSDSILILGDNIFYGNDFTQILMANAESKDVATIFPYRVKDPHRYGVVEFNAAHKVIDIVEKPSDPKSNYAVTGLYFLDQDSPYVASELVASKRGELEITDLLKKYVEKEKLKVELFGRGIAWFDAGTHESLMEASWFVSTIQNRQGIIISCPEEIAYKSNWINSEDLNRLSRSYQNSAYGTYLLSLIS